MSNQDRLLSDKYEEELEEIITDIYMKDRFGHIGSRNIMKESRFLEECKAQIIEVVSKGLTTNHSKE